MQLGNNLEIGQDCSSFILQYSAEITINDIIDLIQQSKCPIKIKNENDEIIRTIFNNLNEITLENIHKYTYHITDEEYIIHGIENKDKKYYLLVAGKTGAFINIDNWSLESGLQDIYELEDTSKSPKYNRKIVDFVKW